MWVVILGRGGNRFYGRFLGAWARFLVAGGVDMPETLFAVVRPLKRLFDSTRPSPK
jgi:hypothetical protein